MKMKSAKRNSCESFLRLSSCKVAEHLEKYLCTLYARIGYRRIPFTSHLNLCWTNFYYACNVISSSTHRKRHERATRRWKCVWHQFELEKRENFDDTHVGIESYSRVPLGMCMCVGCRRWPSSLKCKRKMLIPFPVLFWCTADDPNFTQSDCRSKRKKNIIFANIENRFISFCWLPPIEQASLHPPFFPHRNWIEIPFCRALVAICSLVERRHTQTERQRVNISRRIWMRIELKWMKPRPSLMSRWHK